MSIKQEMQNNNGSLFRTEESKFCCRQWFVPQGDYRLSRLVHVFFNSKEDAENFNKHFDSPPECSEIYDLAEEKWNTHFSEIKYGTDGIFAHQNYL